MATFTETSTEADFIRPRTPLTRPPLAYRFGVSEHQQRRLAHDIERKVLGPMPVDEFLDAFFPRSDSLDIRTQLENAGVDHNKIDFTSIPESPKGEEEMYDGLVSAKQPIASPTSSTDLSATI